MKGQHFSSDPMLILHGSAQDLKLTLDLVQGARAVKGEEALIAETVDFQEIAFVHGGVFIPLHRIENMQIGSATTEPGAGTATISLILKAPEAAVIMAVKDEMKKTPPF